MDRIDILGKAITILPAIPPIGPLEAGVVLSEMPSLPATCFDNQTAVILDFTDNPELVHDVRVKIAVGTRRNIGRPQRRMR